MKRILKVTQVTLILCVAVLLAATLVFQIRRTPRPGDVRGGFKSSDRAILDRSGHVVDEVRVEKRVRRLAWVELDNVPPSFVAALLRAEDKRFFYHPGFDPIALVKASFSRMIGRADRGASTITMQVTELIENPNGTRYHRRTPWQKMVQIEKAIALEMVWSKREILEAYMNLIHYRGELQGIGAASFGLFDKAPASLTRPEAAVIAALIRAPNADVDRVRERACWLLNALSAPEDCGLLSGSHLSYIEQGYRIRPLMKLAPHLGQKLASRPQLKDQTVIRSTLDRQIQWVSLHALQKQITAMQDQNMNDGAVVVLENATGNVLAYVGNIGPASKAPYVDAAVAMRQAGSTLKPLIYARAFDERILTAATVLEDSPLAIAVTTGLYKPANFDRAFRDLVTVRTALASSLNIPAVRTLELLGVETFVQTLRDLGFHDLERADFYGPSLALGSADVRLLELTNAYRALANLGTWSPVRFSPDVPSEESSRAVFSKEGAYIALDIISDRQARASTFGLENTLSTRFWSAVKTGTSKDMRDNWCIGFSDKYTVGVWAGNFSGAPMWNVTGVQGAAPVWQEIMNYLHRSEGSQAPLPPEGIVRAHVHFKHSEDERDEVFIRGTEPAAGEIEAKAEVVSRISYPLNDTLIALDPDIPRDNQRVFIQIAAPKPDQNVYLNDRRIGRAQNLIPWDPQSGRFHLELRGANGDVLDKVRFEVRGHRFALAK
jgi:penicillin-binding protein 1C